MQQEVQILRDVQNRKREMAGLPPEEGTGLSGTVQEGSDASVDFHYGPREQKQPPQISG